MEKLLAMSILSSTPAEISGSTWMNFSIFRKSDEVKERDLKMKSKIEEGKMKNEKKTEEVKERKFRPRFAPEFDGINCFETIVSY
ncbi:hypothetical protein LUZ60_007238 [Juncus effusus]|nr:hypothetical protein LUZ60_007238 [Juncus effusus]